VSVLCIAAHPDDEILGVGGTLAQHVKAGNRVSVLILSEGEEAKAPGTPRCDDRRSCARAAASILGVDEPLFGDIPDQRFDAVPFIELVQLVERALARTNAQIVYTHHGGDANTDHQLAFKATYAACRPMSRSGRGVRRLACYETPSATEQAPQVGDYVFTPNHYVGVQSVWTAKLEALSCYASEMLEWPHPRSPEYVDALAIKRGGEAGLKRAEAFCLIRDIQPDPED
jgi:LmbE family N-acetylglucosaminyl deacetylase